MSPIAIKAVLQCLAGIRDILGIYINLYKGGTAMPVWAYMHHHISTLGIHASSYIIIYAL